MTGRNIASLCWEDHLVFGEGDGRLATADALSRRLEKWRDDLDAGIVHWRCREIGVPVHFMTADGYESRVLSRRLDAEMAEFEVMPRLVRDAGLEAYLYLSLFDEGWPLPPADVRAVSYHNAQHWRHVSAQTAFCRDHPDYSMADRDGETRQWGVLCLAYEEARLHFMERFCGLLAGGPFDGLFLCLRSQSRPADFADQFGFNEPVRRDYEAKCGRSIDEGAFDVQAWRDLGGGYLTVFIAELSARLAGMGKKLAVGAARGDVLGPPLGNATLQWRDWVEGGLIDHLVIDQNSSRCPSTWLDLWPMHRGDGYLQNYLDGTGLPDLIEHIDRVYGPVLKDRQTALYVARQWAPRDPEMEASLLDRPAVGGLVFSTFRHDNPGPVARGDWRA